ncbi:uncharacterized protein LOC141864258 isoform X1 [Acropora palmata]|uniref:uncharacterized protein LOC141864258 isoform X1 n=1 Tax=Acropora palmata TaxID=6131 RepID=UPI003DA1BDB8
MAKSFDMDEEEIDFRVEAEAVMKDIGFTVKSINISSKLPASRECVYLNVLTKESKCLCVELSVLGFLVREGVQISGHTDADADQSGPDFFRFRFNRYRLKRNRQRVKLLHRANYRHHQFLTYICQRLSKDCNRQSRYVTDKNYVGQRLCQQKRSVND